MWGDAIELLSNDLHDGTERLLTNAFDDEDFTSPGDFQFVDVPIDPRIAPE